MLLIIIDDAHLMETDTLRKIRLLLEDFPRNFNLLLVGQPSLLSNLSLSIHQDIKSRVTYSCMMRKLNPDDMSGFILSEFDKAGLAHNTFTDEALSLVVRSADGVLRKARNLCLSCLLEAVRKQTKTIDTDIVNKILMQPHWRVEFDSDSILSYK